ncbi:MAG: hypothetical protein ACE5IY_16545 [bacterium]
MTVEFVCDQCDKDVLLDLSGSGGPRTCPHCQRTYSLELSEGMQNGGCVDRCVICDRAHFYVQKDFNARLGITIFVIGVLLSYHTYFLSLAVATLIDVILYKVLKTVTICYHCRTIYRGFEEKPSHRGFDHELAMSLVGKEQRENEQQEKETLGDINVRG